jgi:putative phage-type endonuclease
MIIHKVAQGSEEWLALREWKLTATHAQAIATKGRGLTSLISKMGKDDEYINDDMLRGRELEGEAGRVYEKLMKQKVEKVGFVEHNKYVGCSPDGFIGKHGLLEIKCPSDKKYEEFRKTDKIEKKYLWQMQMQLLITKRLYCDFVMYNPNNEIKITIRRIKPDYDMIKKLERGIERGIKLIKEHENTNH